MNNNDKLNFCKQCKNRAFNPKTGIVCGLTKEKPSFDFECPHYIADEVQAKREAFKYSEAGAKRGGCLTIFLVLIMIGAAINIIGGFGGVLFGKVISPMLPTYYYMLIMLIGGLSLTGAILMFAWKKIGVYLYALSMVLFLVSIIITIHMSSLRIVGWVIGVAILFALISPKWDNFK